MHPNINTYDGQTIHYASYCTMLHCRVPKSDKPSYIVNFSKDAAATAITAPKGDITSSCRKKQTQILIQIVRSESTR